MKSNSPIEFLNRAFFSVRDRAKKESLDYALALTQEAGQDTRTGGHKDMESEIRPDVSDVSGVW